MKCIICQTEYDNKVVDLGNIFQSDYVDGPYGEEKKYELALGECPDCKFVQLTKTLPPDAMYRKYWYRSGLNKTMVEALKDIAKQCILTHKDCFSHWGYEKRVMDIGCNDGTLLSNYTEEVFKVGFDPANNLAPYATEHCDVFINNYFNGDVHFNKKFDIITSIAMFYDLEDPRSFIKAIKQNLHRDGVWCVQMTDLGCTLSINAFDNICHEHLAYYKLKDLKSLVEEFNLDIFDISHNDVNGKSIRALVCHKGSYKVSSSVSEELARERQNIKDDWHVKFTETITKIGKAVNTVIDGANAAGKTVYGLGASTKGNTLLQVFGIFNDRVPKILEVSKEKYGKYTLGTWCEITSEKEGFKDNPDYLLILPWHFTDFFVKTHLDFLEKGGKFIVPMPVPQIISRENGVTLFTTLDESITKW